MVNESLLKAKMKQLKRLKRQVMEMHCQGDEESDLDLSGVSSDEELGEEDLDEEVASDEDSGDLEDSGEEDAELALEDEGDEPAPGEDDTRSQFKSFMNPGKPKRRPGTGIMIALEGKKPMGRGKKGA
jgi:hypothetical protein